MIERICCYHKPAPILMGRIDDGKSGIMKTHGICQECLDRERAKLRIGNAEGKR